MIRLLKHTSKKMKKIMLIALAIAIGFHVNAQDNTFSHSMLTAYDNAGNKVSKYAPGGDSTPVKNKEYYLALSKRKRNTGWCLVAAGIGLITAGLLTGINEYAPFDKKEMGIAMAGGGLLISLGSIPFFVSGAVNKQRALLAFSIQSRSTIASSQLHKNITGISLNIPFH